MSNKKDATFHPGTAPEREQMNPGQPPWVPPKRGIPAWAVVLIVLATMFVLCSGAVAIFSVGPDTGVSHPVAVDSTGAASPTPQGEQAYKAGMTVRAGDFEYTLHGQKCGIETAGGEYLTRKAQGSFCRLDVSVKNVTRSPHYFIADGTITVADDKARTFSADGEAGIYGNEAGAGFLNEINPGNTVRAFVFFDLPRGSKLASVTISAGVFTTADDITVRF